MAIPNHTELLVQFQKELIDEDTLHEGDTIGTDDETLLRFLRARKFDLAHAKKMFRDAQDWRKSVGGIGLDQMYEDTDPFDYPEREVVFESWPMWFHKTDKVHSLDFSPCEFNGLLTWIGQKGRPLNIELFGGMNLSKLYEVCTPERHWQTFLVNAECLTREVLPAASRAAGKPIGTAFVIVDLKGFGLGAFWHMKSLVRDAFQVSQDYYPETMGQLAIINAPTTFTMIWNVVRPWLSKETAAKIDILGSDYQSVLLDLVDAENIPTSLGGECTCSDVGGCHLSGAGPWQEGRVGWGPKSRRKSEGVVALEPQEVGDGVSTPIVLGEAKDQLVDP